MAATVKKTFDIALDIAASSSNRAFTVVEGDTGNVLRIALTDDGEPVDLTGCPGDRRFFQVQWDCGPGQWPGGWRRSAPGRTK